MFVVERSPPSRYVRCPIFRGEYSSGIAVDAAAASEIGTSTSSAVSPKTLVWAVSRSVAVMSSLRRVSPKVFERPGCSSSRRK